MHLDQHEYLVCISGRQPKHILLKETVRGQREALLEVLFQPGAHQSTGAVVGTHQTATGDQDEDPEVEARSVIGRP